MIDSFRGPHAFLSNFYLCPVLFVGRTYPSSENAYQASKCRRSVHRAVFTTLSPGQAKRLGRSVRLVENWDVARVDVMRRILRAKFEQNPELKRRLLATKEKTLVEGNTWGDTFWGVCFGVGENHLGKLLMELRADFRKKDL